MGKHSKEFYENLTASKQFGDQKIELKGAAPAAYKEDKDIKKLLENAISYLQSACSRLSASEDDRKSERATNGISGERDLGEKRRGRENL